MKLEDFKQATSVGVSSEAYSEFERYCAGGDPMLAMQTIMEDHIRQVAANFTEELAAGVGGMFCSKVQGFGLMLVDCMLPASEQSRRLVVLCTHEESMEMGEWFNNEMMRALEQMALENDTGDEDELLH